MAATKSVRRHRKGEVQNIRDRLTRVGPSEQLEVLHLYNHQWFGILCNESPANGYLFFARGRWPSHGHLSPTVARVVSTCTCSHTIDLLLTLRRNTLLCYITRYRNVYVDRFHIWRFSANTLKKFVLLV